MTENNTTSAKLQRLRPWCWEYPFRFGSIQRHSLSETIALSCTFQHWGSSSVSVSYHNECPPYVHRIWTTWCGTFGHVTTVLCAYKGDPRWIQNQTSIKVHHWFSLVDLKDFFKNPSSSVVSLPRILASASWWYAQPLDMHGDSLVEIIALHHPLVLRHTDLQCLTNIA